MFTKKVSKGYDVAEAKLTDTFYVPVFISDVSGEQYIGGAFLKHSDAAEMLERVGKWVPRADATGSGEFSVLELEIEE